MLDLCLLRLEKRRPGQTVSDVSGALHDTSDIANIQHSQNIRTSDYRPDHFTTTARSQMFDLVKINWQSDQITEEKKKNNVGVSLKHF